MTSRDGRFLIGLALTLAAAWAPGLKAPPVFDDPVGILLNPKLHDSTLALQAFRDPTPRVLAGVRLPGWSYRPLGDASLHLNLLLGGGRFGALRVGNLLIHAAASVLVLLLARRLLGGEGGWACLFFALNPLGVEAVTYVWQRFTCLEGVFYFSCLLAYLKGRRGWAFAAAFLATLSKETAVTIPLCLLAVEWIRRDPAEPWTRPLRRWLPFACLPSLILYQIHVLRPLENQAAGYDLMDEAGFSGLQYLGIEMPVLLDYLRLGALPFPLRFAPDWVRLGDFPFQLRFAPDWVRIPVTFSFSRITILCGLGVAGLLAWTAFGKRQRPARMALALFFLPLALESSIFPVREIAFNHRCYPGLLGLGLLFALGARGLPRLARPLAAAALLLLGILCAAENLRWNDPLALYRRDLRHSFHTPANRGEYAFRLLELGHVQAAERISRQGLKLPYTPKSFAPHVTALIRLGRMQEARAEIDWIRQAHPGQAETLDQMDLGMADASADPAAAEALAARIAAEEAPCPDAVFWLAKRIASQGRLADAEALLRRHRERLSGHPNLWDCLGYVLLQQRRWTEAEAAYLKALALKPDLSPKAWYHIGEARRMMGNPRGAAEAYRKALRLKPDYAKATEALQRLTESKEQANGKPTEEQRQANGGTATSQRKDNGQPKEGP